MNTREWEWELTEAEYTCPAGFLCGWSVGVELVTGQPERPGSQQRHFLQAPKDVFVCGVLIYVQHIRGFTTMRYINLRFTYLLTYLLVGMGENGNTDCVPAHL